MVPLREGIAFLQHDRMFFIACGRNTPIMDMSKPPDTRNASTPPSTEPSTIPPLFSTALTGVQEEPGEDQQPRTVSDRYRGRTLRKELRWYDGFVLALAVPIYLFP